MTATTLQPIGFRQVVTRLMHGAYRLISTSSDDRSNAAAGAVLATKFEESEYIKTQRAKAIESLGDKWLLHRNYKSTPRHSHHVNVWWPARTLRYNDV